MKKIICGLLGLAAGLLLLTIVLVVPTLILGWPAALEQWQRSWPWFGLIALGFGAQVAFFFWRRAQIHRCGLVIAGNGFISSLALVACCLHWLALFLPAILFSAAASLGRWQNYFLALAALSNFLGLFYLYVKSRVKILPPKN